jgi:hypothetical protein
MSGNFLMACAVLIGETMLKRSKQPVKSGLTFFKYITTQFESRAAASA